MATVVEQPQLAAPSTAWTNDPEQRFLLFNIPWDGYEAMLKLLDARPIRVTYDRGHLELMSPSRAHDESKILIGRAVEAITEELDIPAIGVGSTTLRQQLLERGLEPDEGYYLVSVDRVLGKDDLDLAADPPPDLCIEVEISRSALDRMAIYAALGVPEVWRFNGTAFRVAILGLDGTYTEQDASRAFPFLSMSDLARHIQQAEGKDHTPWGPQFRAWVREVLVPRYQPPAGRAD